MKKIRRKIRLFIYSTTILIVIFSIAFFLNSNSKSNYSPEAVEAAIKHEVEDKLNTFEYSKTLEEMLLNNAFIPEYFESYLSIDYLDKDNFLNSTNTFLEKGYNASEINDIFLLSDSNAEKLETSNYIDFEKYKDIKNLNVSNIERYNSYFTTNNINIEDAVTHVNLNLDKEFYSNTKEVINYTDIDILVNKYNSLPIDYVPDNLVEIPGYESILLKEDAVNDLMLMLKQAKSDGYYIEPFSGYRSYSRQDYLYNSYVDRSGQTEADTYSARAGHSEHQTGYAVDVYNYSNYITTGEYVSDEDYKWLLENAYKYGFLVRYIKNSTPITGYIEEPWHLRYFGIELANKIYSSNLVYDEYYDLYIKTY